MKLSYYFKILSSDIVQIELFKVSTLYRLMLLVEFV